MAGGGRTAAAVLFPEDSEHTGISRVISISGRARQESSLKLLRAPLYHGQRPLVGCFTRTGCPERSESGAAVLVVGSIHQ